MSPAERRATPLKQLLREVLPIPTASYEEQAVLAYLEGFAEARGLAFRRDRFGNAYISYRRGRARRPLVLEAHTDHPGFVVTDVRGRRLDLEFRGGLSGEYGKGESLRVYGAGLQAQGERATITSVAVVEAGAPGAAAPDRGGEGTARAAGRGGARRPGVVERGALPVPREDGAGASVRRPGGGGDGAGDAGSGGLGGAERAPGRAVHAGRGGGGSRARRRPPRRGSCRRMRWWSRWRRRPRRADARSRVAGRSSGWGIGHTSSRRR